MADLNAPATLLRVVQTDPEDLNTDQLLHVVQRRHQVQRLFNTLMMVGFLAVVLVLGILLSQRGKQSTAIVQLTSSLGQTCDKTNTGILPAAVQVDCDRAQKGQVPVLVEGITGATGPTGAPGASGIAGPAGQGIVTTIIRPDGHLVITYTDDSQVDLGPVLGQGTDGSAGANGAAGTGITSSKVENGHLIVTLSDGTTQDAGEIVGQTGLPGPAGPSGASGSNGRGIASTDIVGDRLIVTYDDGSTSDAGPVPSGPAGANGRDGSPAGSMTITRTDGSTVFCPRSGGTDDAPSYSCNPA